MHGNLNAEESSQNDASSTHENLNAESELDLVEEVSTVNYTNDTNVQQIIVDNSTKVVKKSKCLQLTGILPKNLAGILSKRVKSQRKVQFKRRDKFKKKDVPLEKNKMTLRDWIYSNPVITDPPMEKKITEDENKTISINNDPEECLDAEVPTGENSACDSAPKLIIAEDGSISIDQSSLVVSRKMSEPSITEIMQKDDTTYASFRKTPNSKLWSARDTIIFYKALSLVGTDFALMEKIFPHRSRRELKLKFKREEKSNIDLINKAIYDTHLTFDGGSLDDVIQYLNDLISEVDSEDGKKDTQLSSKEKKKINKRKKKAISDNEDIDDSVTESVSKKRKKRVKRKGKAKYVLPDASEFVIDSSLNEVSPGKGNETKKRRKVKKLSEDSDDAVEIDILVERETPLKTNNNAENAVTTSEYTVATCCTSSEDADFSRKSPLPDTSEIFHVQEENSNVSLKSGENKPVITEGNQPMTFPEVVN